MLQSLRTVFPFDFLRISHLARLDCGLRAGRLPLQRLRLQRGTRLARAGGDMRPRTEARRDLRDAGRRAVQARSGDPGLFRQGSSTERHTGPDQDAIAMGRRADGR